MWHTFQHRLDQLEAQVGISHAHPTWSVLIDVVGLSQEDADILRAKAERLVMPPGAPRIRIIEVRYRDADGGASDRERLAIWGHRPDLPKS
jgi:hypothetical protein